MDLYKYRAACSYMYFFGKMQKKSSEIIKKNNAEEILFLESLKLNLVVMEMKENFY